MMPLRFSSVLALHWTVAFLVMAVAAASGYGLDAILSTAPLPNGAAAVPEFIRAILAGCFLFVAILFGWTSAAHAGVAERANDPFFAYGAGILSLTVLLVASLTVPGGYALLLIAVTLIALIASYRAAQDEFVRADAPTASNDNFRSTAKLMAQGAAYEARLARISGRAGQTGGAG